MDFMRKLTAESVDRQERAGNTLFLVQLDEDGRFDLIDASGGREALEQRMRDLCHWPCLFIATAEEARLLAAIQARFTW